MNNSDSNDSDVKATLPPLGKVQEVVPDAGCVEDIATSSAAASSTKPASVTTDSCQKKQKALPSTAKSAQSKKQAGGRSGSRNYSSSEKKFAMSLIDEFLPIGQSEWEVVAQKHNNEFGTKRDVNSIKLQFKKLSCASIPLLRVPFR
jgi:hypothetical protein